MSTQPQASGGEGKPKIPMHVYALYYAALFFAHWFGSFRFDYNGDGDFNPEDVHAFLADKGFARKNMRRTKRRRSSSGSMASVTSGEMGQMTPGFSMSSAGSARSGPRQPQPAGGGANQLSRIEEAPVAAGQQAWQPDGSLPQSVPQMAPEPTTATTGSRMGGVASRSHGIFGFLRARVSSMAEEDVVWENLSTGQIVPLFIITEGVVVAALWLIFAVVEVANNGDADFLHTKAGLDSFKDGSTDLSFAGPMCEDYRPQVYRWFTYQFTHVGLVHVFINIFLMICLGVPLEGVHGHLRMALMFNAGVFGGAACNMVLDQHTRVVGCSGGCYALIGIHFADLILNWRQKAFRLPTLLFLTALVGGDLVFNVAGSTEANVSHAAHLGGGISGLVVGLIFIRNLKVQRWERFLIDAAIVFSLSWTIFSLAWLYTQETGPRSVWEAMNGEQGWCWLRAMLDPQLEPLKWRCVRCGDAECVQGWLDFNATVSPIINRPALARYSLALCQELGWYDQGP